jgi:hypothetical protein
VSFEWLAFPFFLSDSRKLPRGYSCKISRGLHFLRHCHDLWLNYNGSFDLLSVQVQNQGKKICVRLSYLTFQRFFWIVSWLGCPNWPTCMAALPRWSTSWLNFSSRMVYDGIGYLVALTGLPLLSIGPYTWV